MRKAIYRAVYFVEDWAAAGSLVVEMNDAVVSSFGEGDDQWSGLDLTDPDTTVTLDQPMMLTKNALVRVEIHVPVYVPEDYWFSPHASEVIATFNEDGTDARGEAWDWGLV